MDWRAERMNQAAATGACVRVAAGHGSGCLCRQCDADDSSSVRLLLYVIGRLPAREAAMGGDATGTAPQRSGRDAALGFRGGVESNQRRALELGCWWLVLAPPPLPKRLRID